jgi:phytoene/squalene synthetase
MSTIDYAPHLSRVSRSFCFCIARLEEPLKEWVGLTYLLCRVLDTVEDSAWPTIERQMQAFQQFLKFVEQPPARVDVQTWAAQMNAMTEGEQSLLRESYPLFEDLHSLPPKVKVPLLVLLQSMTRGMGAFSRRKVGGILRLMNLAEVNSYCFYVAGTVGEALIHLVGLIDSQVNITPHMVSLSHRFGLFLQKVNLLKDEPVDRPLGRYFIPDSSEIWNSTRSDKEGAVDFIHHLPLEQKGFRLFCAWSLALGLATLLMLKRAGQEQRKLNRECTDKLVREVENRIDDPTALEQFFNDLSLLVYA